ncbi:hypothetical protein DFH07DRAFT_785643 [Mycena maculata]|uniref:Zn(2)-C6 fungal-type domain-containing protein n=1 Tax=Mycena maculata TaxID=230809 RepID=A0AAD7H9L2_9AGAR|nr:hypothetical protein DFH07DRAFT_785643 [Mycena maculata]
MPKGGVNQKGGTRGPYSTQACTICRAKKSKCDGTKPCSWGRDSESRKPRTEAHFEALRKRAESLQAYADFLEGILANCVCQDVASHLRSRPQEEPREQGGNQGDNSHVLNSDEEITQELTFDDKLGGLLLHRITAPLRFCNRPPGSVPRITEVVQDPDAYYVLLVDGGARRKRARQVPPDPVTIPTHPPLIIVSGTHYADIGDRILSDLFFGMSSRVSMSLGLGVDSTIWVKCGLITRDEMLARNWAYWTVFSLALQGCLLGPFFWTVRIGANSASELLLTGELETAWNTPMIL